MARYSALLEPEEVIGRFHVRKETCDQLRQQFYSRCFTSSLSSSSGGAGTVPSKAELDLPKWLEWTDGFISPPLAEVNRHPSFFCEQLQHSTTFHTHLVPGPGTDRS